MCACTTHIEYNFYLLYISVFKSFKGSSKSLKNFNHSKSNQYLLGFCIHAKRVYNTIVKVYTILKYRYG